jgi:hypothetical protein
VLLSLSGQRTRRMTWPVNRPADDRERADPVPGTVLRFESTNAAKRHALSRLIWA